MVNSNILNLLESMLRESESQVGSSQPPKAAMNYRSAGQTYSVPGASYGAGDVSATPSQGPGLLRTLAGRSSLPRPGLPRPGGIIGSLLPMPTPPHPGSLLEIPSLHFEQLVPPLIRDFWNAQKVIPQTIADKVSGRDQEADVSMQIPRREDRSGGLGWYVGPPQIEDELKRVTPPTDYRILKSVDESEETPIESPPLAPEIDDAENIEGCDEEWKDARQKCEEGTRGPRGAGPYSIPKGRRGRNYTIEDCMRSVVSKRCGGGDLKSGLSGAERAKRNNEAIRRRRSQ